jgi:transcriptional regulator with XRE-family HTH domain
MSARRPDPLDAIVGAKIRIFRVDRELSQSDLAKKIGVTFQQIQKYEKGANRVGAGRLSRIAAALGVSVGELFESPGDRTGSTSPFGLLAQPGTLRVVKAFSQTSNPRLRRAITRLLESLVDRKPPLRSSAARDATAKRAGSRRKASKTRT